MIFLITTVQQLVPKELASNTCLTNHLQRVLTDVVQNNEIFFRNLNPATIYIPSAPNH